MPFELVFTDSYRKREAKFLRRHPEEAERYFKTLLLLEQNPFHPSLRLHPPKGKLAGLSSVSISLQYRITLEFEIRDNRIIPVHVGTHGGVY